MKWKYCTIKTTRVLICTLDRASSNHGNHMECISPSLFVKILLKLVGPVRDCFFFFLWGTCLLAAARMRPTWDFFFFWEASTSGCLSAIIFLSGGPLRLFFCMRACRCALHLLYERRSERKGCKFSLRSVFDCNLLINVSFVMLRCVRRALCLLGYR